MCLFIHSLFLMVFGPKGKMLVENEPQYLLTKSGSRIPSGAQRPLSIDLC